MSNDRPIFEFDFAPAVLYNEAVMAANHAFVGGLFFLKYIDGTADVHLLDPGSRPIISAISHQNNSPCPERITLIL